MAVARASHSATQSKDRSKSPESPPDSFHEIDDLLLQFGDRFAKFSGASGSNLLVRSASRMRLAKGSGQHAIRASTQTRRHRRHVARVDDGGQIFLKSRPSTSILILWSAPSATGGPWSGTTDLPSFDS